MSIAEGRARRDVIKLSSVVQAYARLRDARSAYQVAITADDRSDIVGMEQARAVRRQITRSIAEKQAAEEHLENVLEGAYQVALAREDADS